MTPVERMVSQGLAVILLLVLGAGVGVWLAARQYRPLLDVANGELATTKVARDNLVTLTKEQGQKLGDLVQAGELRERNAAMAQEKADQEAQPDYAAGNQLLRERTGGDHAQAAEGIIDKELGL